MSVEARQYNVSYNEGGPHLVSLTTLRSPPGKKPCCILKSVNVVCSFAF